jgi:NADH:ubiquinone oxidoreductase subunit E
MGACGGAPMIAINEDYHENVTMTDVERLIAGLS